MGKGILFIQIHQIHWMLQFQQEPAQEMKEPTPRTSPHS